jgi:hypothetical protein
MVNGYPSTWIDCKRGLRQGDSLSLYLFLLMADILQCLIKADGLIFHPVMEGCCSVLQYADDTLLVVRAEVTDIKRLKNVLDVFATATELKTNFNKSTAVPMHVPANVLHRLIRILGCKLESFPQVYLGLPLSNKKLPLSAFSPLIAKVDRYLAGWQALLLNPVGRLVLINSVLDGLPTYLMAALPLPLGVQDKMDDRHRAFLWTGSSQASRAQCLVAWAKACLSKEDGSLGIKRLDCQNAYLLFKLHHRLHHSECSAWAMWACEYISMATLEDDMDDCHWKALRSPLPAYPHITCIAVGDGRSCSLWQDVWAGEEMLAGLFPALFSHTTLPEATVSKVLLQGIHSHLVLRLSRQAAEDLASVLDLVSSTVLTDGEDSRSSCFEKNGIRLHIAQSYHVSTWVGPDSPLFRFI